MKILTGATFMSAWSSNLDSPPEFTPYIDTGGELQDNGVICRVGETHHLTGHSVKKNAS